MILISNHYGFQEFCFYLSHIPNCCQVCFQFNDQAISDELPTQANQHNKIKQSTQTWAKQANHISCQQFSNTELGGGMVIKYPHDEYDVGKAQLHNLIFCQRVSKIYGQYTSHLYCFQRNESMSLKIRATDTREISRLKYIGRR